MRRLLLPALLIYFVILGRAGYQSVTLDEADAFNNFSAQSLELAFYPSSGNHVLNSLLARFSTQAFGMSQFTMRLPAMLGAALYLLAVASIVTRVAPTRRLLGFAILTCNPFMLDYLVAARGYSLALGLLACAVALAMRILEDDPPRKILHSVAISLCIALSLAANFSFAFSLIATASAFLLIAYLRMPLKTWLAITAATALPGLLLTYALVGETLREYPRAQLYFGAETWVEMWNEMAEALFPRTNISVTAFDLEPILTRLHPIAAYAILIPIAIGLWTVIRTNSPALRLVWLALALTLTAHGLAHAIQGLLLPLDRTSIFIAFFLGIAIISAPPNAIARTIATAILCSTLLIFAVAFRTTYFRIWEFDLDLNRGFDAIAAYAKDHSLETVGCTWRYGGGYNFYRAASHGSVPECDTVDQDNPAPRSAYFVITPWQDEFIARKKLHIIYKGPQSGLVVGISPAVQSEDAPTNK